MSEKKFDSFEEFWPFYVSQHQNKTSRQLHFAGTTIGFACVAGALLFKKRSLLLVAPIAGYGGAWIGHFFFEKNKPASFSHPLYSFRGDMKMWMMTLTGAMDDEVERVMAELNGEASHHDDHDAEKAATNGGVRVEGNGVVN